MSTYEMFKVRAWQQLGNAIQARKRGQRSYAIRCLLRAGEFRRKAAAIYY